ncbi:MAG TPA: hypothetical protein VLE95_07400 [Chlamydiales bacterium]|nr:hypothetical protein [Chlamydiales bacterium]
MKKIAIFLVFIHLPLVLLCEEEPLFSYSYWDIHPLHIGANMIRIGKAAIHSNDDGHLYFRKNNAYINMLVPIDRTSYFIPRIEWNNFTLDWNKNPKFKETHFYYAQFSLMFYTTSLEDWRWILRADYNIDLEHFAHPGTYALFSVLAWGKYKLHKKWHYHVGTLAYAGMERNTVYPIFGIDFSPNKYWTFEAVFPITYSIQYKLDKNWQFSIQGRPLKERFRVSSRQAQPRSIFNYSSIGAELNIHYEQFLWLEIEIYAGYNFGGDFYIKNRYGKNALYTDVGGAPYGGVTFDYGF